MGSPTRTPATIVDSSLPDDRCLRRRFARAPRPFRHLSPSIAPKRHSFTVDVTVKLARPKRKSSVFRWLHVSETIEWE
jgi:hypothetical protein